MRRAKKVAAARKEWLMAIAVVVATLIVSLGLIRWFAPQLLGIPVDLQAVRVSKTVPPFFENVFRREDLESRDFLLKDPYTNVRGRPLFIDLSGLGPHDILGFRNKSVPNIADVIAIGDSQTYGNNTVLAKNWPSQLEHALAAKRAVVYSMAVGGWGAVQYLNMFRYAVSFRPRVIIVAFYSGNDPDESVTLAYSVDYWSPLRVVDGLDLSDKPRFPGFPAPESEQWRARFKNGQSMTFTPSLRLVSNDDAHATVRAGYQIIAKVAELMAQASRDAGVRLVLTVIPTKELVYAERVRREGVGATPDYDRLVSSEKQNIDRLSRKFVELPDAEYIDLVSALQRAALRSEPLYPSGPDGHPLEAGNRVIATALAPAVAKYVRAPPIGLIGVMSSPGNVAPFLATGEGLWNFAGLEFVTKNGWVTNQIQIVPARDIASLQPLGTIDVVDPKRFGPQSLRVPLRASGR